MLHFPGKVDAEFIGQLHLIERLVQKFFLGAVCPGARQLVLVEDSEFHRQVQGRNGEEA